MAHKKTYNTSNISMNYHQEIRLGNIPGREIFDIYGTKQSVGVGVPTTVWTHSVNYTKPTSGQICSVVSTSALDNYIGGTGALTVFIEGIDSDGEVVSETVQLSGVSPTSTTNAYIAVNKFQVSSSGSTRKNQGDILIYQSTSLLPLRHMRALSSRCECGLYTVPARMKAIVSNVSFLSQKTSGGPHALVKFSVYNLNNTTDYLMGETYIDSSVSNIISLRSEISTKIDSFDCVEIRAYSDTTNTSVYASLSLDLSY